MKTTRRQCMQWGGLVLLATFVLAANGCGNSRTSSATNGGSSASTVGGSSVTGDIVKVDLTTNRTKIAKGDVALVAIRITCSRVSGNCPLTDSEGLPYFAAQPFTSTGTTSSSLPITANYSVSAAGAIVGTGLGASTQTVTLAAGTAAVFTSGVLTTAASLGGTTRSVDFTANVTGVSDGVAILTVQSFSTVASIAIDVTTNTSGILK